MKSTNQKTRVVFCLPTLIGGGAERILIKYMNALDPEKYDVSYCSLLGGGPLESLLQKNIDITFLNSWRVSTSIPSLFLYLLKKKPDVVISTVTHANFACLLLRPLFPFTKFVAREAIVPSFFFNKYKALELPLRWTFKLLYPLANCLLSPSNEILEEFKSDLGMSCKNAKLLYNPVDTEKISGLKKEANNLTTLPSNTMRFVCAGRLEQQKGFDRMINILATSNLPYDWTLTILGEGVKRNELETLIRKHNLDKNIKIIGFHLNPYPYYAGADYFLMTPHFEGMPNVALEALACGTPIIALEHPGGIFDIAGKAGPEAVKLAKDEKIFAAFLSSLVVPEQRREKVSLLPSDFYQDKIISQFKELVQSLTTKSYN